MAKAMKKNKTTEVLKHMKQHKYITSEKAFEKFGVTRLGSIIFNLREHGYLIDTVMVESVDRYGNKIEFGRYYYRGYENV